ncbi:choice-of-anchor Q domain-containing protein [Adhaeretor mobilis]|uniref:Uncharacterized protein n=1 Tax=Adhaeretor mobilis TaxID=1930276 RepID=A0A517MSV8_9BACT|nr:choice-of-anchor Q domain-containing protein [Adhaeretor mobilis]QDS97964.1 hypothetical protein HG15A2_12340 [Adhaeretor mobilis]
MQDKDSHRTKRLKIESLEDRRMLAVFTVSNLNDGPVAASGDLPGSLRQAIFDANNLPGDDEIQFALEIDGPGIILLSDGELEITDGLTITGPGQEYLTIDAQQQSRVLFYSANAGDLTIKGVTVTGGETTGEGAGISFISNGELTVIDSHLHSNNALGSFGSGGAIFTAQGEVTLYGSSVYNNTSSRRGGGIAGGSRDVELNDSHITKNTSITGGGGVSTDSGSLTLNSSTVTGNISTGSFGHGGGIYATDGSDNPNSHITLNSSNVSGNRVEGYSAGGGGIWAEETQLTISNSEVIGNSTHGSLGEGGAIYLTLALLTLDQSTVQGNSTIGEESEGGGIYAVRSGLTIIRSTLSDNTTQGYRAHGGGIRAITAAFVTVEQSTLSGNGTRGQESNGGAISAPVFSVSVRNSTITRNYSMQGIGGGIFAASRNSNPSLAVGQSIISGNSDVGVSSDVYASTAGVILNHSLIGDTTGSGIDATTGAGNLLNIDPLLGPLADNGGPTQTHALLPGSPAIDAGDIGIVDPPMYDQRGAPFNRIVDGNVPADVVIDIGAYEAQGVPSADFAADNAIDGFDFLTWQTGFGTPNATQADGDSDFDGDADASDLAAWNATYGQGVTTSLAASRVVPNPGPSPALAIAAALADAAFHEHGEQATLEGQWIIEVETTPGNAKPNVGVPARSLSAPYERDPEGVNEDNLAALTDTLLESVFV